MYEVKNDEKQDWTAHYTVYMYICMITLYAHYIFRTKPRIRTDAIDMSSLRSLPVGTLGREYIRFMDHYVCMHVVYVCMHVYVCI